ncbi:MAG: zinc metallopeptidase [Oscillospiraceae bacterium]|nr:zinc metallopeptidase [Oscillospiraceae bacterium]
MQIYGLDIYLLLLVAPTAIFAMICQFRVSGTFKKYSQIPSRRRLTGADAARRVCQLNEASHVTVEQTGGNLTDHYDPRRNVIRLSQSVYAQASVAAIGVAAHEAGHAAQYAQGYGPARLRMSIVPITQLASNLAMPLILMGLFISSFEFLFRIGVLCFAVAFLFQVVTLPVEFNASRRALATLESGGMLDSDELYAAKKVLNAAAMTYVAAMAVSLAQLLRLILLSNRRR